MKVSLRSSTVLNRSDVDDPFEYDGIILYSILSKNILYVSLFRFPYTIFAMRAIHSLTYHWCNNSPAWQANTYGIRCRRSNCIAIALRLPSVDDFAIPDDGVVSITTTVSMHAEVGGVNGMHSRFAQHKRNATCTPFYTQTWQRYARPTVFWIRWHAIYLRGSCVELLRATIKILKILWNVCSFISKTAHKFEELN